MSIMSKKREQARKQINRWSADLNKNPRADSQAEGLTHASRIRDWAYGAFIVLDALGEEDLANQATTLWTDALIVVGRESNV